MEGHFRFRDRQSPVESQQLGSMRQRVSSPGLVGPFAKYKKGGLALLLAIILYPAIFHNFTLIEDLRSIIRFPIPSSSLIEEGRCSSRGIQFFLNLWPFGRQFSVSLFTTCVVLIYARRQRLSQYSFQVSDRIQSEEAAKSTPLPSVYTLLLRSYEADDWRWRQVRNPRRDRIMSILRRLGRDLPDRSSNGASTSEVRRA